jgi:DNA repair protein RecO (recombination protein O)
MGKHNMYAETEGIILRQVKTVNGRRMVLLFSEKYGKISAGTSLSEKGRSRAALAMRPFTHGRYDLFKNRDTYNVNGAEVVKSYYGIGEDVEKYMAASYILEFTEKMLPEDAPDPRMFRLLLECLDVIEGRKKEYMTVVIAFQLKAFQIAGITPETGRCVRCGSKDNLDFFSTADSGLLCGDCRNNIIDQKGNELICDIGFDIIEVLRYFFGNSLKSIGHMALNEKIRTRLYMLIKEYRAFHLGINGLLSEEFLKYD